MKIIALSTIVILALAGFTAVNTETLHTLNVETGQQLHIRTVFAFGVSSWTEPNEHACENWSNPMPGLKGRVILSKCTLWGACSGGGESSLIIKGCGT
jgi:hypothetical protein